MARKILLADDSVTIQKVVELTFMDEDYEVVAVGNGTDALERFEAVRPDLMILDVHMPGANGYEVCRSVKQSRPSLPVLLLVGTFEPFDEGTANEAGASGFLKKPFDSQELLRRVDALLAAVAADAEPAEEETVAGPAVAAPSGWDGFDDGKPSWEQMRADEDAAMELPPVDDLPEVDAEPVELPPADQLELEPSPWEQAAAETSAVPSGWEAGESGVTIRAEAISWSPAAEPSPAEAAAESPEDASPPEAAAAPVPPPIAAWAPEETPTGSEAEEPGGASSAPSAAAEAPGGSAVEPAVAGRLSDDDVERIARRVVELIGDRAVRDVVWEVVPDMAEVVIKERIRELERQVEA